MYWGGHGDGGPSQVDTVMEASVMWTWWWRPQSSSDVDTVMEAQSSSDVDTMMEAQSCSNVDTVMEAPIM